MGMIGVLLAWLLTATACLSNVENKTEAAPSAAVETASNQVQSNTGHDVERTTPISTTPATGELPSQTEGGAGGTTPGAPVEPAPQAAQAPIGAMLVYADPTYKFSIQYPADFITRTLATEKLAQLKPTPTMAVIFMNPTTAASSIAELEPADLEIRAYDTGGITVLENWLTTNALLPTDGSIVPKPLQTANIAGLEVCASTMAAPGCAYFVMSDGWVYQLTPATLTGESMINSFMLIP